MNDKLENFRFWDLLLRGGFAIATSEDTVVMWNGSCTFDVYQVCLAGMKIGEVERIDHFMIDGCTGFDEARRHAKHAIQKAGRPVPK